VPDKMHGQFFCGHLDSGHTNDRRTIRSFNCLDGDFNVQDFDLFRPAPGGNHFHRETTEFFFLVSGRGLYRLQRVSPDGTPEGEIYECVLTPGMTLAIGCFVAHASVFSQGARLLCVQSKAFNQASPDAYPLELIRPEEVDSLLSKAIGL